MLSYVHAEIILIPGLIKSEPSLKGKILLQGQGTLTHTVLKLRAYRLLRMQLPKSIMQIAHTALKIVTASYTVLATSNCAWV